MASWARGEAMAPGRSRAALSPAPLGGTRSLPAAWQPDVALQRTRGPDAAPMQAVAGALTTAAQLLSGGGPVAPGLAASAFMGMAGASSNLPRQGIASEPPMPVFWRNAEAAAKAAHAEGGGAPPERHYKLRFTGRAFHEVDHASLTEGLVDTFGALFRIPRDGVRVRLSAGSVLASVRLTGVPGGVVFACADVQAALEGSAASAVAELASLGLRVAEVYTAPARTHQPASAHAGAADSVDDAAGTAGGAHLGGGAAASSPDLPATTPAVAGNASQDEPGGDTGGAGDPGGADGEAARVDSPSADGNDAQEDAPPADEDDTEDEDIWDEDMVPLSARQSGGGSEKQRLATLDLARVQAFVQRKEPSKAALARKEAAKNRFVGAIGTTSKMAVAARAFGAARAAGKSRLANEARESAGTTQAASQDGRAEAPDASRPSSLRDKFKARANDVRQGARVMMAMRSAVNERSMVAVAPSETSPGTAGSDSASRTSTPGSDAALVAAAEAEAAQALADAAAAEAAAAEAKAQAAAAKTKALALAGGGSPPASSTEMAVADRGASGKAWARAATKIGALSKFSMAGKMAEPQSNKVGKTSMDDVAKAKVLANKAKAKAAALAPSKPFSTSDIRVLFSYARHNKYHQLKDLLEAGAPADPRDKFGNTPLIIACQNGNARVAKVLMRHGADMDKANKQGNTGLHYCVAYGFNALGDLLIAKGASDKILNSLGYNAYEGIK